LAENELGLSRESSGLEHQRGGQHPAKAAAAVRALSDHSTVNIAMHLARKAQTRYFIEDALLLDGDAAITAKANFPIFGWRRLCI